MLLLTLIQVELMIKYLHVQCTLLMKQFTYKRVQVIQNRHNGSVDFDRGWQKYTDGFGSVLTEYWIGNNHFAYGNHCGFLLHCKTTFFCKGFIFAINFKGVKMKSLNTKKNAITCISVFEKFHPAFQFSIKCTCHEDKPDDIVSLFIR